MRKEVKMTCRKFRKQLIPWLDGELAPAQDKEMRDWLLHCGEARQCTDCRKLAEEYKRFHHIFSEVPQPEFPAFLHHRIMDEIKRKEPILHKKEVRTRWQLVPATLAVLVSLYFGSLVGVKAFGPTNTTNNDNVELYTFGENGMMNSIYYNGGIE